ncbi:MAG: LamG domain-containing protein [Myxococcota bacterium]
MKLTVATPATTGLRGFTAMVMLVPDRFDYAAVRSDGFDLAFVDESGLPLPWERDEWVHGGWSVLWVKIDVASSPNVTAFTMYYGDPLSGDGSSSNDAWREEVAGVWHLRGLEDSSRTNAHCMEAASSSTTPTPGQVGSARQFSFQALRCGSPVGLDGIFNAGGTAMAWIRPNSFGEAGTGRILVKSTALTGWDFYVADGLGSGADERISFAYGQANGYSRWDTSASSITLGEWQHVAVVFNAGSMAAAPQLYINGELVPSFPGITGSGSWLGDEEDDIFIGDNDALQRAFDGAIDEVRMVRAALDADWLAAEHRSMTDTLLSWGPVEDRP